MFIIVDNVKTKWYLHSHFVWLKLFLSILDTSFDDILSVLRIHFYIITGGFLLEAKAIPSTRGAGGLFYCHTTKVRVERPIQSIPPYNYHRRSVFIGLISHCHFLNIYLLTFTNFFIECLYTY